MAPARSRRNVLGSSTEPRSRPRQSGNIAAAMMRLLNFCHAFERPSRYNPLSRQQAGDASYPIHRFSKFGVFNKGPKLAINAKMPKDRSLQAIATTRFP